MKLLEPLVRQTSSRYSLDDYASWLNDSFFYNGHQYPVTFTQQGNQDTEHIGANFAAHVGGALKSNSIVAALELVRVDVFSQARPKFRNLATKALFGTIDLVPLETPWPGGTTDQLLAKMLLHADLGGNAYVARDGAYLICMRPDYVDIVLRDRRTQFGQIGYERIGYVYYEDGNRQKKPTASFSADEVAHWAPMPDPEAEYRGMSWMTPVAREIQGDTKYTAHKLKFLDNAATPNLAVTMAKELTPLQFEQFVDLMDRGHQGIEQAYKTLYLGGGADVTVVGSNMQQLDFKVVQGAGETRLAAAAGVGAVMAQFSEGLQGSALNAGNYGAARRRFADVTMRKLWLSAFNALAQIIRVPNGAELWFDEKAISFLQEDAADAANIFASKAQAIRTLTDGGYDPASVVAAVQAEDPSLLTHTGLVPVQLQPPGAEVPALSA